MGLEVRYRGRIKDIDCIEHFEQHIVRVVAALQGWSMLWNSPDNPHPSPVRGITIQLLPNQPLVSLLIAPTGELISLQTAESCEIGQTPNTLEWCSTCTEQSGHIGHCLLLNLLAVLQQHWFHDLEVDDSSGQWPRIPRSPEQHKISRLMQDKTQSPTFEECLATMQPDDSRCCSDWDEEYEDNAEDDDRWSEDETMYSPPDGQQDVASSENDTFDLALLRLSDVPPSDSLKLHVSNLHGWARKSRCIFNTMFDPDDTVATRAMLMLVHHCNSTEELLPLRSAPNINSQIQNHLQRILWFASSMQFTVTRMTVHSRLSAQIADIGHTELKNLCHKAQLLLLKIS